MLIDYIDKKYSSLRKINKIQSIQRFLIRNVANLILPFYLKVSKRKSNLPITDNENVIISITTFPQRISKIWLVIETILRQKTLPNKIILWLSKDQFPNGLKDLPNNLLNYVNQELIEIIFIEEDLRSHKKYFYAFREYPNDIIITLDDDIFYTSNIISDLLLMHKKYPNAICCHRAHKVNHNNNGEILPYRSWKKIYNEYGPSLDMFHTSGGGTLYKKNMFTDEILDKEIFKKYCFFADDVWLNVMAQISKTRTVKSDFFSHLIPILDKNNNFKLSTENVLGGKNDEQINNLIKHYKLDEKDMFKTDF